MKERLDVLLVKLGIADTRERAKAYIMEGSVFVNGEREDKAGAQFPETAHIEFRGQGMKYVSRGGYKLEKMIEKHNIDLTDTVCMDIGSSTGGFTDCMLQNGAKHVYAIDVGTNQLAWKLRTDPRVTSMEKTNIRNVTPEDFAEKADFASVEVSFISLRLVLVPAKPLLSGHAHMVCLIKPQFEAGREKVGKGGIVREKSTHMEVLREILGFTANLGFKILDVTFSPIKGTEGNIEYLMYLENSSEPEPAPDEDAIKAIVEEAHGSL